MQIRYAAHPCLLDADPGPFSEGDLVDVPPDGSGYDLAVQTGTTPDQFLSVQPNASYEFRPGVGGSYERFRRHPDPALNVIQVKPRTLVYSIAVTER